MACLRVLPGVATRFPREHVARVPRERTPRPTELYSEDCVNTGEDARQTVHGLHAAKDNASLMIRPIFPRSYICCPISCSKKIQQSVCYSFQRWFTCCCEFVRRRSSTIASLLLWFDLFDVRVCSKTLHRRPVTDLSPLRRTDPGSQRPVFPGGHPPKY